MSFTIGRRQKRQVIPAQRISILGPNTPIGVRLATPHIRALHISIAGSIVNEVAGELFGLAQDVEFSPAFGTENPYMASLLQAIMVALDEPARFSGLKIEYLSRALVADVLAKHANLAGWPMVIDTYSRLNTRQMKRVLDYIEEHLAADITLNELSSVAAVSRTVFIRRFKATANCTPHQYLIRARVRRGRELLQKSDLSIVQIAHACGFADHAHFTTVFKRALGVTPSAYRRDCK